MTIRFKPHSEKQQSALFSNKKIILTATGIQWGKTAVGAMKMKMWIHTFTGAGDNFIITAPTYKIMQQATLPAFLRFMEGYGEYLKVDALFRMHNGGTCYFRTGTDPDSVVGIRDVRGIWGDECGKYSLYFWENIQARASIRQCQIILTTSPYTLNWVNRELILPHRVGVNTHEVDVIQAASWENPYFPKEEFERKRKTMDPRRFKMIYGGEFDRMAGLVYDCFSPEAHVITRQQLPAGTKYVAGVDWGYTNPFALVVVGITASGDYYVVDEHYETKLTIEDMKVIARRKSLLWGIERFYCDPSSPANIEEFNRARLTALPANNDVRAGIDHTYELLRTGRLRVFEGSCRHLIDELESYHYQEDQDQDGQRDVKELQPVKQQDHLMDALRYVCHQTYHSGVRKRVPKVPSDQPRQPQRKTIDELLRLPDPNLEEWS